MKAIVLASVVAMFLIGCTGETEKVDVNLQVSGESTDKAQAIPTFNRVIEHCPGIAKYRNDIASFEYDGEISIVMKPAPKVVPIEAMAMRHTCRYSIVSEGVQTQKRPCMWVCTGADQTGINGDTRTIARGEVQRRNWGELSLAAEGGELAAQRELAYSFAEWPYPNQQKNMVLACAWALTSFNIAPKSQKRIDEMHVDEYCRELPDDEVEAARNTASKWVRKIKIKNPV